MIAAGFARNTRDGLELGNRACDCGAAGMLCPSCNTPDDDDPRRPPRGFKIEVYKDGWRH